MSGFSLKERVLARIRERVDEAAEELVSRKDTIEEVRLCQGRIAGLREAAALLEMYRDE